MDIELRFGFWGLRERVWLLSWVWVVGRTMGGSLVVRGPWLG